MRVTLIRWKPSKPTSRSHRSQRSSDAEQQQVGWDIVEVLEDRGGRSPLIIKDLDLYPQPPTNTHSPTLNSEEPDSRYQLSAQLHVGGLLAPIGLSVTIAAMGPSANHTTRTLIREELFNHTAYEIQIAVMFVPPATSFLRLSFPPVVTSTLCA